MFSPLRNRVTTAMIGSWRQQVLCECLKIELQMVELLNVVVVTSNCGEV